ncbi:MAG TPA: ABC transporter permease [Candidatus Omnitrophota bacterium]|jgi:macrolide transport system ATP-binding/permease protein|nr:ABC transporter permease [Candidatus Omnitrophota bacterium]HPN56465.1 ABC transporter permease [Candidatus Omnitrophota bacterium]
MIALRNVSKTYRVGDIAVHALRGVSLEIKAGEFIAIMGPSGSGKSTLLHILGFLDQPDEGEYFLNGQGVKNLSDDDLANIRNQFAGFVFQQFHLLRRMSAQNNVSLPCIYGGDQGDMAGQALRCLGAVGLQDRARHWPSELSGGQQQRVAIARALVRNPMIIFADEPTGNLDSTSEREIMRILKSLNDQGKTIIMVTHELEIAEYAGRVITMRDGRIISDQSKASCLSEISVGGAATSVGRPVRSFWKKEEWIGHFRQAANAIFSNKIRSLLSMLGILVGVAAVIAMLALGAGAQSSMEEQLKSMGSNLLSIHGGASRRHGASSASGAVTRFSPDDVKAMLALTSHVKRASGVVSGSAQVVYRDENCNTRVQGVGYEYGQMRAVIPENGRWFLEQEFQSREKVAIIGMTVVEKLFKGVNPMGKIVKINRLNFRIVGVAPSKGFAGPNDQDDVVYIPATTAMFRVLGKDYLDNIYVEVADTGLIEEAKEKIEALIKKRHKLYQGEDSFYIRDMSEIQDMLSSTTKTMSLLLGCIAAISLVVGGIGIMNIMLVSVTERTREIGLRKAVGARKVDIMMQFLIESMVMTFTGGLMGIAVGAGAALLLSSLAGWATQLSAFPIVLATSFSIVVGIVFGLWPAQKAAGLKPVEALRYE